MTNFNEGTNTLLYKNISLTLYPLKGWCWLRVRSELETGTDCYILSQVLLTIAALLSHLGLGCSTVGHWGPKAHCLPLVLNSASCLQLTSTATHSSRLCPDYILFDVHLLPLFFRLFTQVHLLTDGSVEGQYVTQQLFLFFRQRYCSVQIIKHFFELNFDACSSVKKCTMC